MCIIDCACIKFNKTVQTKFNYSYVKKIYSPVKTSGSHAASFYINTFKFNFTCENGESHLNVCENVEFT